MKVNIIGNTCNNAYAIAKFLRKAGIDAHLFYNKTLDIQTMPYSEDPELLDDFPRWLHPYSDEDTGPHPFRSVKKEFLEKISDCDLIQAEDVGIIWAMQTGKPYIWVPYGWDLNFYSFYSYWKNYLSNDYPEYLLAPLLYRRAIAGASAVSWGLYDQNLRHGFQIIHDLVEKNRFVHNNTLLIDTARFAPQDGVTIEELLREAGRDIPVEGLTIFFPSRLMFSKDTYYSKRSDVLFYAAGKLRENGIPFTLIIVEKGNPDEQLAKEIIKNLNIEDRTVWIPKMERHQLARWYSAADITADEFASGAIGSLVIEAMACRGKVMAYFRTENEDTVSWPSSLAFAVNPPLINVYSVDEAYEALKYYSSNREELQKLGESGRDWVEKTISGESTAKGFITLYERILAGDLKASPESRDSLTPETEKHNTDGYLSTVERLVAENKYKPAYDTVIEFLDKAPDDPQLIIALVRLMIKDGKALFAIEALKYAIELMPDERNLRDILYEIYVNLYKYFLKSEDIHNSIHFCSAAIELRNNDTDPAGADKSDYLTLAELYIKAGRYAEFLKYIESLERRYPGSDIARAVTGKFRTALSGFEKGNIKIRTFENISVLGQYLGFEKEGRILEENIDVMDHECDLFARKRHDAEVLTTVAANVEGKCFDIGTSFGGSAFKLATNVPDGGIVYTVNILPDQFTQDTGELITHMITKEQIGSFYRERGVKNVVQLYANTLTWQVPDELNDLDMVFVDGGHDAFTVYSDTKNIYNRIREGGYVLWHDFNPMLRHVHPWINEVMNGIERFLKEFNITSEIVYLKDSWIGILKKESRKMEPEKKNPRQRTGMDTSDITLSSLRSVVKPAVVNTVPKDMRSLKYMVVYPGFSEKSMRSNEEYVAGLRKSTGLNISSFHIPCNGTWLPFPLLDKYWKEKNPVLMKAYEELMQKASETDVLINAGGSMLHPEFVKQLPTYNVFICGDDPESSEILSKPIAPSYDYCFVTNIASVEDYRQWGCRNAEWIFHPIHDDFMDSSLKGETILYGSRNNDIIFLSERSALSDRDQRITQLIQSFPQAIVRGNGWPGGYLENLKQNYLQTKIGWNFHHSTGPTNRRTFELPALGLMQICDNKSNLGKIFRLDVEAVGFDTIEECSEKTRYYLAHDSERREIAYNGWKKTIEEYTIRKWWDKILNSISEDYSVKRSVPGISHTSRVSVQPADTAAAAGMSQTSAKKKILLIADVRGWIFERHCMTIKNALSDEFEFDICYMNEPYNEDDYDLIYPMEFQVINMQSTKNPAKYITGIRSHWAWEQMDFGQFCMALNGRFQRIHTVSRKLFDIFRPHIKHISYVTHGVDTSLFVPSSRQPSVNGKLRIGWAGNRETAVKGFKEYIEPLAHIPGIELVFVGFRDTHLRKDDMLSFYNSIDVYICASATEGNNNSLMEAAAMEKAIITTDNGTVSEYLINGRSALIVNRELHEFVSAVEKLRDNPGYRTILGKEARKAVVEKFDWKIKLEDYRDMFRTAFTFNNIDDQKQLAAEFEAEGKTEKTITLLLEIIRNYPGDMQSTQKLADLLRKNGQDKLADTLLQKSAELESMDRSVNVVQVEKVSGKKSQTSEYPDNSSTEEQVPQTIVARKSDALQPVNLKERDLSKGLVKYYPTAVHFLMNDKCNAKCVMCGGDYARSTSGKSITYDKFVRMCENLHLENFSSIVLAGAGDPLLNRDLVRIIKFVNEKYPKVLINITTNGIALSERITDELIKLKVDSINISINSSTAETYMRIMQVNAFEKVCKNVKYYAEQKMRFNVSTILQFSSAVNRINIDELPQLVPLSRQLGVQSINIMYCRFYPRHIRDLNIEIPEAALKDEDSLFFAQELSDMRIMETEKLARMNNIRFTHEPLFRENSGANKCVWPETQLMVGFDGEVYPCGGGEIHFKKKVEGGKYKFGNVLEQQLPEFWNDSYYCALRISSKQNGEYLIPECRNCANLMSPNKYESHIMTWEGFENEEPEKQIVPEKQSVPEKQIVAEKRDVRAGKPAPEKPKAEMKHSPLVSVIVPTYNRPEFLEEAIKSILDQTYTNFEVIVVNDAGQDVRHVTDGFKDNRIRYIRHENNKGLGAARNTGIRNARGKYIAYLDDDDIYYPDHLSTLVGEISKGEFKVVYSDAYRAVQELKDGKYEIISRDIPHSNDFSRDTLLIINISPVQCFMHEKACSEKLGLFEEYLRAHEDWEYWIRLSRVYDFKHIPTVTSEFRQRNDSTNMSTTRQYGFYSSYRDIIAKYYEELRQNDIIANAQLRILNNLKKNAADCFSDPIDRSGMIASVIIPVFNQLKFTRQCLAALYRNTPHNLAFETIIVDNGSDDGTREFLRYAKEIYPNLIVISNSENLGFAKANNIGAENAAGKYLVCLNNDTEVQPGWLESLISIAEDDDKVGAVGSKLLFPDGTVQHAGVVIVKKLFPENENDKFIATHMYYGADPALPEVNVKKTYQVLTAASLLIRKTAFVQAGGFFTGYWNGYEDVDLCLNLSAAGWKLVYQPESVAIHHESQSGPERFSKNDKNVELLLSRWLTKGTPDFTVGEDKIAVAVPNCLIKEYVSPGVRKKASPELTSIIVLTYNGLKYNREFIDSVTAFTKSPYELIVVDNASTDGTVKYLKNLAGKNSKVKLILNDTNLGFPKAVNQGIKASSGNYILIANNDIVVTEGWLERMINAAESSPLIGIVGPISNSVSGVQLDKNAKYKNMPEMHKYAKKLRKQNAGNYYEFPRVAFLCTLIKKEVIDKIGGLDERFSPGNYEDDDFCLRAQKAGYKAVIAKEVFIHHYGSKSFKADGEQKYAERLRINEQKFVDKWGATIEEIWLEGKPVTERNLLYSVEKDEFIQYYQRAVISFQDYEFELAEDNLKNALQTYEQSGRSDKADEYARVLNLYGNLFLMAEDFENAHSYFERELAVKPDSPSACIGLGQTFLAAELYSESKNMFEWAVRYDPESKSAAEGLASVNTKLNLQENHNSLLEEEITLDIPNYSDQLSLAESLIESGKIDEALDILGELLRNQPDNADVLNDLAVVSIMVKDYEAASDFIERVLKLNPQDEVALGNLAYLEEQIDMHRNEENKQQSRESMPQTEDTVQGDNPYLSIIQKAEEMIESGDLSAARKMLETILMMEPENIDAMNDLSVIEIMEENLSEAVNLIERVIKKDPRNQTALDNLTFLQNKLQ